MVNWRPATLAKYTPSLPPRPPPSMKPARPPSIVNGTQSSHFSFSPILAISPEKTNIPAVTTTATTLPPFHLTTTAIMDDLDDRGGTTTPKTKQTTPKAASTPLSRIAEAFEDLSRTIKSKNFEDLRLGTFSEACSLVSVLFGCLGIAFRFAEIEYVAKVQDLVEASKTYNTLRNIIDHDVQNDTVRKPGSLSRNLRRVRQGLDLIRALFEQFLSSDECSLREAASSAYAEVCAPYHTWAIRTAVFAGMYALPSKQQLTLKLNETDKSVEKEMRRYIDASLPVIEYIDKLYIAKNISLDW